MQGRYPKQPPERVVKRGGRPRVHSGIVRICQLHGPSDHAFYGRGPNERLRCKRCVADAVTRRHRKVRALLVEEAGGACAVCGYDRAIYNLHFHHVNPATKSFSLTAARGKSLAAYRLEAKKCVLVCANCHGEIEMGLIPSPPPGTRWMTDQAGAGNSPN